MLMVSRQVLGSYTVLSDCKGTLAHCRSPNLAVGAGDPIANVWKMIAQNEEFHPQAFKHVKGHATPTDVIEGVLSDFELTGNATAD
eukprot:7377121-Pyramimonas_sp.AAC.1